MEATSVLALVAVAIVLVLIVMGVRAVPQGTELTIERFGRYQRTLRPGLNLIVPFVDRVGSRINMMERVLEVPSQSAITKDNAVVIVDAIVFFQALDAAKAAYEVKELDNAILNLTMTNIRTVIGAMDLDELLSRRDEINTRLLHVVDEATSPWGVKVTRIEIKDITPPQDIIDSMGRQMKAERDRRAAILQAEGARQAAILEAEGQRQAAILRAEGEKQGAILEAEGRREAAFRDAEARERLAEAEAKATAMLSTAIEGGTVQAANYYVAQRYLEALEAFARSPNQKTLVLPIEATAALGSLAGILELARAAGGPGRSPTPAPWGERPGGPPG